MTTPARRDPPGVRRLLWVTTKSPWPPVDGGRLLVLQTLAALAEAGVAIDLVAPVGVRRAGDAPAPEVEVAVEAIASHARATLVPVRPPSAVGAFFRARRRGGAWTLERHRLEPVARAAAALAAGGAFDAVIAEQIQAWAQVAAGGPAGPARLVRAENVESDLWSAWADVARGPGASLLRPFLRQEARRLALAEGRIVATADGVAALSAEDAARLEALRAAAEAVRERPAGAGGQSPRAAPIATIPAPFPERLDPPAGAVPLRGNPAIVVVGSAGWRPNRDQVASFVDTAWPRILESLPEARLHLFGAAPARPRRGVERHPAPADAASAFAPGAILAVPVRVASGIRMKILEAWARGTPVVSTRAGAAGLATRDGREILWADEPEAWARALGRLHREPALRAALVAGGRAALAERHAPRDVARAWIDWIDSIESIGPIEPAEARR